MGVSLKKVTQKKNPQEVPARGDAERERGGDELGDGGEEGLNGDLGGSKEGQRRKQEESGDEVSSTGVKGGVAGGDLQEGIRRRVTFACAGRQHQFLSFSHCQP